MGASAVEPGRAHEGNGPMDIAHAIATGVRAARRSERRFAVAEAEIRAAERRVVERRTAAVAASGRREYTERGRHAAPRPARA